MRLNRFDLTRYGKFTDTVLSFPLPDPGQPDLHIIYGQNEAGKSSFLSGWLDFLYQIPPRSPMNFLHGYGAMQLGGEIDVDGTVLELTRIKKRDNSLLDAQSVPQPEAILQHALRGLDRSSYSAMFSLNGETLAAGGESILRSEGDLGQLLFSASAGLNDLDTKLASLRSECEAFLSETGRKGELLELIAKRDSISEKIKSLDILAGDYRRMVDEREQAEKIWNQLREAIETARKQRHETETLAQALPVLNNLTALDERIAAFGDLPRPPIEWIESLAEIDVEQAETDTRISQARHNLAELSSEIKDAPVDDAMLKLADAVESARNLKAAYDTANQDLPKRRQDRDMEAGIIANHLAALDQKGASPEDLQLKTSTVGRLTDLIETRSGIVIALEAARREMANAEETTKQIWEKLSTQSDTPQESKAIASVVARLRREDPEGKLNKAREDQDAAEQSSASALRQLQIGPIDPRALDDIRAPNRAWLEATKTALQNSVRQVEKIEDERAHLQGELAKTTQVQEKDDGFTVTLAQAAEMREQREAYWAEHRQTMSAASANKFEKALRLDDQATNALTDYRIQRAATSEVERAHAAIRAQLEVNAVKRKRAEHQRSELRGTLRAMIKALSPQLNPDMTVEELMEWLEGLELARESSERAAIARRATERAEEKLQEARSELTKALRAIGAKPEEAPGFARLLEIGEAFIDKTARDAAMLETLATSKEQLEKRRFALASAEQTDRDWQDAWRSACRGSWLADLPADPTTMRVNLTTLQKLNATHDTHARLDLRIRQMEQNRDRFIEAIRSITSGLGLSADGDPNQTWATITERLARAIRSKQRHEDLQNRHSKAADALKTLEADAELSRKRLEEMTRFFGVSSWGEARSALARARERQDLLERRDEAGQDLCNRLNVSDPSLAKKQLEHLDAASLQARLATTDGDISDFETQKEEAYARLSQARKTLESIDADGTVAALDEERATLALEIADRAEQHLRRKLGLIAVEAALRRYRDTHRSGMLDRASKAFRTLTCERYRGLAVQPDGSRDLLVAMADDGSSKRAQDLSDGTRAQLYLSLRIAGYHEFSRAHGPIPFVADDIMESFDDDRAAEAFRLLGDIGRIGQVIYLTHHAHVCDIARSVHPEIQVHHIA